MQNIENCAQISTGVLGLPPLVPNTSGIALLILKFGGYEITEFVGGVVSRG
jgi:hypothetical protein